MTPEQHEALEYVYSVGDAYFGDKDMTISCCIWEDGDMQVEIFHTWSPMEGIHKRERLQYKLSDDEWEIATLIGATNAAEDNWTCLEWEEFTPPE